MNLFENRKLLIATKHGKEEVLKPLLESSLKVKCFLNTEFDTDVFGTFSREVIRKENALTTLRNKCLAAMSHYNCDLAVAVKALLVHILRLFFQQQMKNL